MTGVGAEEKMFQSHFFYPTPLIDKKIPTPLSEWKKNIYHTLYEAVLIRKKQILSERKSCGAANIRLMFLYATPFSLIFFIYPIQGMLLIF